MNKIHQQPKMGRLCGGWLAALVIGGLLAGCQRDSATTQTEATSTAWADFMAQFEADYFAHEPTAAVYAGRHEYDGQLPDWTASGLQAEMDWLQAQRTQAAAWDSAQLSARQRFERDYLLAVLDGDLFWMIDAESPQRNPTYYLGTLDPDVYLTRPYASLEQRAKAFIAYARKVPTAAEQIRANLRLPLPKTFVSYAINGFAGYASFYREDVPAVFKEVNDPQIQADLAAAIEPAAQAMQTLADWMKTQQATATDDFALGKDKFVRMLNATERVTTSLDQLLQVGQADLARNEQALQQACADYAPKLSLQACVDKVSAHKPEGGAVAAGMARLAALRQFILDKQLATIPGDEQALVKEAPAYNRWNLAYINIAGPYDKGMPSVYYIAPPDPSWSEAEQLAYVPSKAFLEFVTVHEVWPGHFLQFLHANRSDFKFGQLFVGYGYAEGWAHYAEEMMWDAGLDAGDAEMHIGQLQNALMRNVRFMCAIGLHTQGMTVEQCEQLFHDKAFLDAGNARQQAARGTYDPAYLNYTMGKLMIKKLREDWTASRGGRAAWKDFHDQFLSYGGPPIPLVREQMLQSKEGELF